MNGSPRTYEDLCPADRAWAVVGMDRAGVKGQEIADRLDCCVRVVFKILASDLGRMCELAMDETAAFEGELGLVSGELATLRGVNAELAAELARTQANLGRLLDEKITGERTFKKCGHRRDKVNTYRHEASGKEFCRACHADRQRSYRSTDVGEMLDPVSTI